MQCSRLCSAERVRSDVRRWRQDVVSSLAVSVTESTFAQCGSNHITFSMRPSAPIPPGASITFTGLNGDDHMEFELSPASSPHFSREVDWNPAVCFHWCSQIGLCPSSGSALDDECLSRPTQVSLPSISSFSCCSCCPAPYARSLLCAARAVLLFQQSNAPARHVADFGGRTGVWCRLWAW